MTPLDSTYRVTPHDGDAKPAMPLDSAALAWMTESNQRVAAHADTLEAALGETSATIGALASSFQMWRETLRRPTR